MQPWRRPVPALLALLALATLGMPSFAWYCPMTGRMGDAAYVCAGMKHSCEHKGKCCCRPVQMPARGHQANLPTATSAQAVFLKTARQGAPQPATWSSVPHHALPADAYQAAILARGSATTRAGPSCYLGAQHGLPPFSGRAPPANQPDGTHL